MKAKAKYHPKRAYQQYDMEEFFWKKSIKKSQPPKKKPEQTQTNKTTKPKPQTSKQNQNQTKKPHTQQKYAKPKKTPKPSKNKNKKKPQNYSFSHNECSSSLPPNHPVDDSDVPYRRPLKNTQFKEEL